MDLTQFERIKTEQKQERYGSLKIRGPRCEGQELPGFKLRKGRGIYIIMYINSRVILQDIQGGFMCESGIFLGGSMEDCQDLCLDQGITWNPMGLDVKQPRASTSSGQMRMAAWVAPLASDSSTQELD
jgi:hypothetical protein